MAFIQITQPLNANPANINSGDTVSLTYTVNGNNQANLTITYWLDPTHNVFFEEGGNLVKTITDAPVVLNNPPMPIQRNVKLVKDALSGKADTHQFDINVKVSDGNTNDQDSVQIHIA